MIAGLSRWIGPVCFGPEFAGSALTFAAAGLCLLPFALGLIRELNLLPDRSHVRMILTTPFCPYGPQMLEQVRMTVQETTGVPTTIEFSPELWDPSMIEEGAAQDWGLFY